MTRMSPIIEWLRYVRYADDFLLGFAGPKQEAEGIKERLRTFLRETLKLELSEEKTLITRATTEKARFLGYDISITQCNSKITRNRRSINGGIALRLPVAFVHDRCRFYMKRGKPIHRMERTHNTDYSIVCQYQSEYRGYVQYYQLADNIAWLSRLQWVMRTSLLKTLAHKHKSSVPKMAYKYTATVKTDDGPRRCLEVSVPRIGKKPLIARFGDIPLKVKQTATIADQPLTRHSLGRTELLQRLMAETCEVCGSTQNIEVHHIRKLADVNPKGRKSKPDWMHLMASRQRKTLVLCRTCHDSLHAGRPLQVRRKQLLESRDAVKAARPVRRGDDGKGVKSHLASVLPYFLTSKMNILRTIWRKRSFATLRASFWNWAVILPLLVVSVAYGLVINGSG